MIYKQTLQTKMIKVISILCLLLTLGVIFIACNGQKTSENTGEAIQYKTIGTIERLSPKLDALVAAETSMEILAEGHEWTEGPVWVAQLNMVLYSDIPRNSIYSWSENKPSALWLKPAGYTGEIPRGGESGSNGLTLDNNGNLLLAQHGDRRIAKLVTDWNAPEAKYETLVGTYDGKRFNSPNDMAIKSNGDIYFTDPPYGLEHGMDDPVKELDFQGVYRLAGDGSLSLLTDEISRPNGIAFSPDESTLYVANSDQDIPVIMAYDVEDDGSISNGRIFFESWGDGIKVDQQGNLYIAGPGNGVIILSPQGEHLGSLHTNQRTSNCAFGNDGYTMYITSDMFLVRVRLKIKGMGF